MTRYQLQNKSKAKHWKELVLDLKKRFDINLTGIDDTATPPQLMVTDQVSYLKLFQSPDGSVAEFETPDDTHSIDTYYIRSAIEEICGTILKQV